MSTEHGSNDLSHQRDNEPGTPGSNEHDDAAENAAEHAVDNAPDHQASNAGERGSRFWASFSHHLQTLFSTKLMIAALAVAMTAAFLLATLVAHLMQFDRKVPDAEQIFYIKQRFNVSHLPDWMQSSSLVARNALQESGLALQVSAFMPRNLNIRYGERVQSMSVTMVDPAFRKMFGLKALAGDLDAALTQPDALALTENAAIRIFGNTDVIGKSVLIAGQSYRVVALLPNCEAASSIRFNVLAGMESATWQTRDREQILNSWGSVRGHNYVKIGHGVTEAQVIAALDQHVRTSPVQDALKSIAFSDGKVLHFKLGALRQQQFDPDIPWNSIFHDRSKLQALAWLGLALLLVASLNYLNLVRARVLHITPPRLHADPQGQRAPARRMRLEIFLVYGLALLIGLSLTNIALPSFSALWLLDLSHSMSAPGLIAATLLSLLLGLTGSAWLAWRSRAASPAVGGLWMRRIIALVQWLLAFGLITMTLAVAWQIWYVSHLAPGFETRSLYRLDLPVASKKDQMLAMRQAVAGLPGVSGVAWANEPITSHSNGTDLRRASGKSVTLNYLRVSNDFFDVHGIAALAGRVFSATDQTPGPILLINASAAKALGFATPQQAIGETLTEGNEPGSRKVIGVIPDLAHRSAREPSQATYYVLAEHGTTLTLRYDGDHQTLQEAMQVVWSRHFPNDGMEMELLSEEFEQAYKSDVHHAWILAASSLLALLLAACSLQALLAYAQPGNAQAPASREALRLVVLSLVLGMPMAGWGMAQWLKPFSHHAPMGWWPLILATVLMALLAWLVWISARRSALGAVHSNSA